MIYTQELTYLNKQSILEPVAVLLPIKKDLLVSKLCAPNVQSLPALPTEGVDSTSKTIETEKSKEKEIVQQGTTAKRNIQNSQNFVDNANQNIQL